MVDKMTGKLNFSYQFANHSAGWDTKLIQNFQHLDKTLQLHAYCDKSMKGSVFELYLRYMRVERLPTGLKPPPTNVPVLSQEALVLWLPMFNLSFIDICSLFLH